MAARQLPFAHARSAGVTHKALKLATIIYAVVADAAQMPPGGASLDADVAAQSLRIHPGLFGATHESDQQLKRPLLFPIEVGHQMTPAIVVRAEEDRPVEVALPANCSRVGWFGTVQRLHGELFVPGTTANLASGSTLPGHNGCVLVFNPVDNFVGEQELWFTTRKQDNPREVTVDDLHLAVILVAPSRDAPVAVDDAWEVEQDSWAYIPVLWNDEDADITDLVNSNAVCFRDGSRFSASSSSASHGVSDKRPWLEVVGITDSPEYQLTAHIAGMAASSYSASAPCVAILDDAVMDVRARRPPPSPLQRCVATFDRLPAGTEHVDVVVNVEQHTLGRVETVAHQLRRARVNGTLYLRHVAAESGTRVAPEKHADGRTDASIYIRESDKSVRPCDLLRVVSVSDPLHGHAVVVPAPDTRAFPCFASPASPSVPEHIMRSAFEKAAAEGRLGPDGLPIVNPATVYDISPACAGSWVRGGHVPSSVFMTALDILNTLVLYYPEPGYIGTDTFTYDVGDGHPGIGSHGTGKVNLTVVRKRRGPDSDRGMPLIRSDAGPCASPWRCIVQAFDGRFNSMNRRDAGSMMTPLRRIAPAAYEDGIDVPSGSRRPSTRLISNVLFDQVAPAPSAQGISELFTHFGQLLTHDIDFSTPLADFKAESNFVIPIPKCDPWFDADCTGTATMRFRRSGPQLGTGAGTSLPREQLNKITAWLDLNIIYGTLNGRNRALRSLTGGKLLHMQGPGGVQAPNTAAPRAARASAAATRGGEADAASMMYSEDDLEALVRQRRSTTNPAPATALTGWGVSQPGVQCFNTTAHAEDGITLEHKVCKPKRGPLEHLALNANALPNLNLLGRARATLFVSGDNRANVQPGLTAMHTLVAREHNTICDELQAVMLAMHHGIDTAALQSPYGEEVLQRAGSNATTSAAAAGPAPPPHTRVTVHPDGRVEHRVVGDEPVSKVQSNSDKEHASQANAFATSGGHVADHIWHALHPHAASFHVPPIPALSKAVLEHIPGFTVRAEGKSHPVPVAWPHTYDGSAEALSYYDEAIFHTARAITRAKWQAIVWYEYLALTLGAEEFAKTPIYTGYRGAGLIDPSVSNEFATAAFRFGHSQISSSMHRYDLDTGCESSVGPISLRDAYFTPMRLMVEGGVDPLIAGSLLFPAEEVDTLAVPEIRNFLFGTNTQGFDLIALNIQRGRDHGIPDYNTVRAALGLPRVERFEDITRDPEVVRKMRELYANNISDVDLTVGGLAEDHVPGGAVGPTFAALIRDVFVRIRDADRFWFEAAYMPCSEEAKAEMAAGIPHLCTDTPQAAILRSVAHLEQLRSTRIADLLARNTAVLDGVFGREIVWSSIPVNGGTQPVRHAPRERRVRSSIPPTLAESLFVAREVTRPAVEAVCAGRDPMQAAATSQTAVAAAAPAVDLDAAYGV